VGESQALRYGIAACVLALLRVRRSSPPLGRREWARLVAAASTGAVVVNAAVLGAVRAGDPASVGLILGCAPLLVIAAFAAAERRRPSRALLVAGMLVVGGTALSSGTGGFGAAAGALSLIALAAEGIFAVVVPPLVPRLGAAALTTRTPAVAASCFAVALPWERLVLPTLHQWLAVLYLALAVSAASFLLWYSALPVLGPPRAALFTALGPPAAVAMTAALGARFRRPRPDRGRSARRRRACAEPAAIVRART
jgi:drug/metabolite transporter (DMT)-like permease